MMTKEERVARDPHKQHTQNERWPTAFKRFEEPLTNSPESFQRLERFLPRVSKDGAPETDAQYTARCKEHGLIETVTHEDVRANPRVLAQRLREAAEAGVPLMLITGAVPDRRIKVPTADTATDDEARKAAMLDALRNPQRHAQDAERARQADADALRAAQVNALMESVLGLNEDQLAARRGEFPADGVLYETAVTNARAAAA